MTRAPSRQPPSRRRAVATCPWMLRDARGVARVRSRPGGRPSARRRGAGAAAASRLVDEAGASDWVQSRVGQACTQLAGARAHSAFSVSGTVLLDLLHHRLARRWSCTGYRTGARAGPTVHFLTAPYFASVNLLAGRDQAYPEFCFHGEGPRDAVRAALLQLPHATRPVRSECRTRASTAPRSASVPPGAIETGRPTRAGAGRAVTRRRLLGEEV